MLSEAVNIPMERMTRAHQTHTDKVKCVTFRDGGYGVLQGFAEDDEFDGMITGETGLMLGITVADCVPVLLHDPVRKCIAAVHSGWRGTAKEISANAIGMMAKEFQSNPSEIEACIGPCICSECYEVGAELIDEFRNHFSGDEIAAFFTKLEKPDKEGKYLLDLRKAILTTLVRSGLKESNITVSKLCTFETEELGSWRRTGNRIFQNLAYIALEDGGK